MPHAYVSAKSGLKVESALSNLIFETVIHKTKIFPVKDIYMTFLLGLNDDFDDDLLQDAIEILADDEDEE